MRISSFFKVYKESTSSKYMQLPQDFVEELEGFVPKKPTLKNSKGRSWTVHIEKKGEDFFFMNGWSKFVSDILLEDGHVLVFDYDGDLCFEFMHFGHSKCEQFVQPQSTMNDLENVEEDQDEDGEDDEGKEEEDDDDDDKVDDEDYEADEDTDDSCDYYEYDDNDVEEEGDDETEEVQEEEKERLKKLKKTSLSITQKEKKCPITRSSSKKGKAIVESNVGITVKGKTSSSIEIPEFESGETIFKYGVVKRPENPYFVTRLRRDKPNELHLPAHIMKDYNIKLTPSVMLVDQEGRQIYTKVVTWKDGRTVLTRGWKLFIKFNKLVEEDRCICEFVMNHRAEQSSIYLKMTVLRAGSWLPK